MLEIQTRKEGKVTVLTLVGQLVFGPETRALAEVVKKLAAAGEVHILVDLGQAGFVDSGGLGEIVASYSTLKRASGDFGLCNPTKAVADVLKIVRLPTIIPLFDTVEMGLSQLNRGSGGGT